jgi:hypothetical protein
MELIDKDNLEIEILNDILNMWVCWFNK